MLDGTLRKCRIITAYGWRDPLERRRWAEEGAVLGVRRPTTTAGCAARGRQTCAVINRRFLKARLEPLSYDDGPSQSRS